MNALQAYALAKAFTIATAEEFGAVKGAPCTIKSIVNENGRNIVTFEWTNSAGQTRTSQMIVRDGTPIYTWESGHVYHVGDLVIYASGFYKCVVDNEDVEFNPSKWEAIGSPDGNYDIVERHSDLPPIFTSADRKVYYVIEDGDFYVWDGYEWTEQKTLKQYTELPTPAASQNGRIVQYVGASTDLYGRGMFYECVWDETEADYVWRAISQDVNELTNQQVDNLVNMLT